MTIHQSPEAFGYEAFLAAHQRKEVLRFIACGSVDDGKSTLIGRLLHDTKQIFDDQISALQRDSRKHGTQGQEVDLALLVDGLQAEREQGITIDVAYRYFSTAQRSFIVADTPGHEQYTRNMATGASTADLAIILVDARKGLLPQTRRHSFIVSLVGVRRVVVAVNKMDLVGYDEAVFRRIEADYRVMAAGLGFTTIDFIPVSARDGENVTQVSRLTPWYRGPALLPFLEAVTLAPEAPEAPGFALPVQWVNRPDLDFRGYAGMVAQGRLRVGDSVTVLPTGRRSTIARIFAPSGEVSQASAGQSVTVTLADEVDVSRGDVIASLADGPLIRQDLRARLLWTGEAPLREGGEFILKLATATANASVTQLQHRLDVESFAEVPADDLPMNAIGLASLRLDRPLAVQDYAQSRELGGFILIERLSNQTVAFGFIDEGLSTQRGAGMAGQEPSLRRALVRELGRPGSARRHAFVSGLSWRAVSSLMLAGATIALGAPEGLAATLAIGDFVLRPLAYRVHERLWRRDDAGALQDGAGI